MSPRQTAAAEPVTQAEYVRRLVESWPPLTPDQCDRIKGLLHAGGGEPE